MEIARALITLYLVTTLSATGLAKLVNRKATSAGMMREGVFGPKFAMPIVLGLACVEISTAVLMALEVCPRIVFSGVAALFTGFAAYRIVVAIRFHTVVCSCAGTVKKEAASPAAVAGGVLACTCLAALAGIVPFLGQPYGYPLCLISLAGLVLPVASMAAGFRKMSRMDTPFPAYHITVGTEDLIRR
jgi:hypothetical protein